MQGRILRKPIEERKFKLLCEHLVQHFPDRIMIDGKKVDITSIRFHSTFSGSGLTDKNGRPFFVQIYSPSQPLQYFTLKMGILPQLLTAIPYEQFHQMIAGLPNDWKTDYLKCLNLVSDDLTNFQRREDAIVQQINDTFVQQRKTIPLRQNFLSDVALLEDNLGLFYMHNHYHLESWHFLCDKMAEFARKNVSVCYVEMSNIALSPLFLEFERTGDAGFLKEHLDMYNLTMTELPSLFYHLAISAKHHGVSVIPVDSSVSTANDLATFENLFAWNKRRDNLIAANISIYQRERNHPKFIALFGSMHLPVAKKLNVPSVLMKTDGQAISINTKRVESGNLDASLELLDLNDVDIVVELSSKKPKKACCSLFRFGLFAVVATSLVYGVVRRLQSADDGSDQQRYMA